MSEPVAPSVHLPDRGDGSRRQRRRAKRASGRRRAALASYVGTALVIAGALAWAVFALVDGDDRPTTAASDGTAQDDGPGPSLVLLRGTTGELFAVTVLAPARGAIVHVPPGTLVEVPSLDLATLRDAAKEGGVELVQHSLENLLGVPFAAATELDPAALAALVEPLGDLTIEVPDAVEERAPNGRVTVVVPAGPQSVPPAGLIGVLEPVGDGTSLERVVRQQAFWDAYLAALGEAAPAATLDAGVASAVRLLADGDVRHQVLPVEVIAGVDGDDELFRVADDELADMIARLFPGASPPEERVRVRILNGAGVPGVSQRVQPLLVEVGGEVTLSGNADRFDYATTQIVYYDDEHLADAEAIRDALGVGELLKSLTPLDVVDVTIVVGADFLAAHGG